MPISDCLVDTAYRTSRLLNLHVQKQSSNDASTSSVSDELERRCFWSCWMTSCISQENAEFKSKPWESVVGLMLPSDEDTYASGNPFSAEFYDEDGNIKLINPNSNPVPSHMGQLVKLLNLWYVPHSLPRILSRPNFEMPSDKI